MIEFFSEEVDFRLSNDAKKADWVKIVVDKHSKKIEEMNFIFCSDAYLLKLNQQYLSHDYLTDILTFSHHDNPNLPLSADIYISIERVRENGIDLKTAFEDELDRVMIHGVLHLIGFDDHKEDDILAMRKAEEYALSLRDH